MSAFIVGKDHIDYLVTAALELETYWRGVPVGAHNATTFGGMLLAENITSVRYRYSDYPDDELPGPVPTPSAIDYQFRPFPEARDPRNVAQVLKAISCYEYQSCEHPGWESSEAYAACQALRKDCCRLVPGYDDAQWEVTRTEVPTHA